MERSPIFGFVQRGGWWLAAGVLGALLVLSYNWMSRTPTERERVRLQSPLAQNKTAPKKATMIPGRVVELHTNRGEIDFILFEKDCPETSGRIAKLAADGSYNGIRFTRVEKEGLIQIEAPAVQVAPMCREIREGLTNTKGAVGMARTDDPNSATSVFYILLEPWQHLDYEYTVFGRVIRGMDVVAAIRKGDVIKKASVRAIGQEDRRLYQRALQIESERRTGG